MITDEQVRRIALFFLFTLMDEKVALQAAHKVVAQLKASGKADVEAESADLIRALRKQYHHYVKQLPRNRAGTVPSNAWSLPENFDLMPWVRFQKDANEQEVVAVTLSKVLGFEDEDIASGLNISLGTARYRIGRGVRNLGVK